MRRLIPILIAIILFWAGPVGAATYYCVYDSGTYYYKDGSWATASDNDGSSIDLNQLLADLDNAGNVIVLEAGTYTDIDAADGIDTDQGNFTFRAPIASDPNYSSHFGTVIIDGSAIADVIFRIVDGDVTLSGDMEIVGGDSNSGAVLINGDISNVKLDGLTIKSGSSAGDTTLYVLGGAGDTDPKNVEIVDCTLICNRLGEEGINVSACDNPGASSIHGCTFINESSGDLEVSSTEAIKFFTSNSWSIYNNSIGSESKKWSSGIDVNNSDSNLIYNNSITWCWDGDDYPNGYGFGVTLWGTSASNEVYRNWVYRCNKGIFINNSAGSNTVKNNLVVSSPVNGIDHQASSLATQSIFHNTIYHFPTGTAGHGIALQADGVNADIRNNVVYGYTAQARAHNIHCLSITDTAAPNEYAVVLNNNVWYPSGTCYLAEDTNGTYDTIATWQAAIAGDGGITGKDSNSSGSDPLFIDAANDNFHLFPDSPCINAGAANTLSFDYEGRTRGACAMWTIGAYLFGDLALCTGTIQNSIVDGETLIKAGVAQQCTFNGPVSVHGAGGGMENSIVWYTGGLGLSVASGATLSGNYNYLLNSEAEVEAAGGAYTDTGSTFSGDDPKLNSQDRPILHTLRRSVDRLSGVTDDFYGHQRSADTEPGAINMGVNRLLFDDDSRRRKN